MAEIPSPERPFSLITDPNPRLVSQWVTLSKDMFPKGTLGYEYFTTGPLQILEGRRRPANLLERPVEMILDGEKSLADLLAGDGIATLPKAMQKKLRLLSEKWAISNHARLAAGVLEVQGKLSPITPEQKEEIMAAVDETLAELGRFEKGRQWAEDLRLHFGLDDYVPRSRKDVDKVIALLHHPRSATILNKLREIEHYLHPQPSEDASTGAKIIPFRPRTLKR